MTTPETALSGTASVVHTEPSSDAELTARIVEKLQGCPARAEILGMRDATEVQMRKILGLADDASLGNGEIEVAVGAMTSDRLEQLRIDVAELLVQLR